ncbi:hypothetical protein Moror_606 [Moniliophthora roreri MCA 2997]|uniref:Uncharacterized protein n=1 Tax=Moniliophthora roreri (strain MCA 2997) TaxID=1381753 RepID=V2WD23_MONRO|nr:hypothetical protein Moror_606 [Moniliophthora roreri MCA 2997]
MGYTFAIVHNMPPEAGMRVFQAAWDIVVEMMDEQKASALGWAPILVDKEVEAKSAAVSPNGIASPLNMIRSTQAQRSEVDRKLADLE